MPAVWLHALVPRVSGNAALYSIAVFLSAFLLFLIQPMVGRFMLPVFGGSAAVWGVSLVFFTGALFLGYSYVYVLSFVSIRRQILIHRGLLALGLISLVGMPAFDASSYAILPWSGEQGVSPMLRIVAALTFLVGIPYFLIATTGPLLQQWYTAVKREEPYHLYALSNFGSLLALGMYPFIIEPLFGLLAQQELWTSVFALLLLAIGAIMVKVYRAKDLDFGTADSEHTSVSLVSPLLWSCLAAIPAALLTATTVYLSQVVSPMSLFWVVPLSLYLLSFIAAFRGWGGDGLNAGAVVLLGGTIYAYLDWSHAEASIYIALSLTFLFSVSLYCHALMYKKRPHPRHSSLFYVWVALGGALGTIFASIAAPFIFVDFFEIVILTAIPVFIAISLYPARTYLQPAYHRRASVLKALVMLGAVILLLSAAYDRASDKTVVYRSRNFYGGIALKDRGGYRFLYHGTTLHGMQSSYEKERTQPTTYYTATSGVGRALRYAREQASGKPLTVGTIGLGVGTVAAWCKPGDTFIFYEIDPRITEVAEASFTYLRNCAGVEVRHGDGRLLLEAERAAGATYDVLAVDAFSDDMVPTHLLTKEAVELFVARLRNEDSILAIHVTSRYLDLDPVVTRIAQELGLSAVVIGDYSEDNILQTSSRWVLLSRNAPALSEELFTESMLDVESVDATPLWTDDYTEMFSVVHLPSLIRWGED